jgi:hypothetical protein
MRSNPSEKIAESATLQSDIPDNIKNPENMPVGSISSMKIESLANERVITN